MRRRYWYQGCVGLILMVMMVACGTPTMAVSTVELPGSAVPEIESPHIPYLGAPHASYTSTPPTSGPHVPQTVAPGVYREAIAEELQVHALEHGHVLIQYAPGTAAEEVQLVEQIAREYPRDVIVAPYAKLESGIALTAWARLERLEHADQEQIVDFVRALSGRYVHGWQR